MNGTHIRRFILTIIVATVIASLVPLGIAGASARDTVGAERLSPSEKAFELFSAVFNNQDADAASTLIADDAVLQTPYGDYVGPQGVLDYVALVKRSYPDAQFDITSIEARGGPVVVRWTITASSIHVDPYEQPVVADVTISGKLTLATTDGEITGMTQTNESLAVVSPADIVVSRSVGLMEGAEE